MKKYRLLIISILTIYLTGCFNNNSMNDIKITTSAYPIEYVVDRLYGSNSEITSIYPKDDDIKSFEVTDVLLEQYNDTDLFIFNGLSDEKDYVSKLNKHNNNLKIIDISSNINYNYSIEELWLDPNNLLTISNNIKKGFEEYIDSTYLTDIINKNYENLKIELTNLDGKYYSAAKNANNKTIIVTDDSFKFLEKYGITVISLDPDTVKEKNKELAKELIDNGTCNYIFTGYLEDADELIKDIADSKTKKLQLYTMTNLNGIDINKTDYITLMNQNLEELKQELYK